MFDLPADPELPQQFLEWLEKQPPTKEYNCNLVHNCALAQYLKWADPDGGTVSVYWNRYKFYYDDSLREIPEILISLIFNEEIKTFGQLAIELKRFLTPTPK